MRFAFEDIISTYIIYQHFPSYRFYVDCAGIRYIDGLIGIPSLEDRPPDFDRQSTYIPPPRWVLRQRGG